MTPIEKYQLDLKQPDFVADPYQAAVIEQFDELYQNLLQQKPEQAKVSFWHQWFPPSQQAKSVPIKGLYLWGGVGRGKTYLMDLFFETLPTQRKQRIHFHRFMQYVHRQLGQLEQQVDPLKEVAKTLNKQIDVLCFDEFFVSDITDAMILANLFEALFAQGIILVATSNIPPHDLYRNGLQRARFLPTIALLEQHCQVIHLDSPTDYRLRQLEQAKLFYYPLTDVVAEQLQQAFISLSREPRIYGQPIHINNRTITTLGQASDVLYCQFSALCQTARSANDYIEIARLYHTVIVEGIPVMDDGQNDAMRRFIALVDEFYERRVKLLISSQISIEHMYQGTLLRFEFERCCSRLIEMQSHDYLAQQHCP
ncbi:TPA: cell division protein ZapE [Photobacterium damselae]